MRTQAEIDAAVDAFNAAHPPRLRDEKSPRQRMAEAISAQPKPPQEPCGRASSAPFRGVYSTRTGHRRTWKREIRNPR